MAGRYTKVKENRYARRKRVMKAEQGVLVSEEPQQASGKERIGSAMQTGTQWGKMGSKMGGPVLGGIAAGAGTAFDLAMTGKRNRENREIARDMRAKKKVLDNMVVLQPILLTNNGESLQRMVYINQVVA